MKRIQLAPNSLDLSSLVFGTMNWGVWGSQLNTDDILNLIHESLDLGLTSFDHADIYGHNTTEGDFGKALKAEPSLRHKMEIITKCGIKLITPNRPNHKIKSYDTSKEHIIWSTENSLKELNTDYIDLLLIHRPSPLMNPDEIAEAFTQLRKQGKVRYFGTSNFTPSQFNMLNSRVELVTNQVEASVLHLDPFLDGTFDLCLEKGICPMIWSPLAGGKVFTDIEDERVARVRSVAKDLMEKHNVNSLDQIILAWLLKHPSQMSLVLGTTKISRIKSAVNAIDIQLTDEEWFEIWSASLGNEVP